MTLIYYYPETKANYLALALFLADYVFPYITIVTSVVSCAYHFAKRTNQVRFSFMCFEVVFSNLFMEIGHYHLNFGELKRLA